jgi:hypothetical protein
MKYLFIIAAFVLASTNANALIITGNANIENGNQIKIDYSFEADAIDVDFFSIFFNANIFDNLAVTANTQASQWDVAATQSEDFFGTLDDGFVDFEALLNPLFTGEIISGFQISADIIDSSVISGFTQNGFMQDYIVFDILTFDELQSGSANVSVSVQSVSAPLTLGLFSLAIFAIAGTRARANLKDVLL